MVLGSQLVSLGFGFRNNSGTLQFKNSGGAWSSFGASAAASKKTTILTGSVGAGLRLGIDGGFDISGIAGASQTNMIDVFCQWSDDAIWRNICEHY